MMWFLLLLYTAHIGQVITQADETKRLILEDDEGSNPCEGHVKLYHKNVWGYLGDKYWSSNTERVVCRSAHCGEPVENSTENTFRTTVDIVGLNEVNCSGSEKSLWDCQYPCWDSCSFYQKMTVKKIKCSHQIKITLDGFKCAGAVQYSTNGKTPSGYFCADNWGKQEANRVCAELGCGSNADIPEYDWMVWKRFSSSKKMMTNCFNTSTNLWQCATQESSKCQRPASVICTNHERLQLRRNSLNACSGILEVSKNKKWLPGRKSRYSPEEWCQLMYCGTNVSHTQTANKETQLNCSNKIEVVLLDNNMNPGSYGKVYIKVNDSNLVPACASKWTKKNAEMVCRELNYGGVVESYKDAINPKNGMIDYVDCTGTESSLWHCKAKRDLQAFPCDSNPYVACSASIETRLAKGSGRCAGTLEIRHEGRWKKIHKNEWSQQNSNIVCNKLNCGNVRELSSSRSSTGRDAFLEKTVNCKPDASDISECSLAKLQKSADQEALEITCEEHKMIFLNDATCSGEVVIKQGSDTYWLSGSTGTWTKESADVVCAQMHCGKAITFGSIPTDDMRNAVSKKSYNCSSDSANLFDCENDNLPSDHDDFVATVTCSGDVSMNLTNDCWGHVNVCINGECGGVCANTWTEMKSVKLCEQQSCGSNSLASTNQHGDIKVLIKSVHSLNRSEDLKSCSFVKNDDDACGSAAFVICSGSVKPKLEVSRDKCSGNVELLYEGQWLPVCKDALKDKTQNIICEQLGCGQPVNSIDYFGPKSTMKHFISNIECPENATSLTECKISAKSSSCTAGGLRCSNWKTIALTDGCRGTVSVQPPLHGNVPRLVSAEGFSDKDGQRLCQDLNCGTFKTKDEKKEMNISSAFNCTDVKGPKNIWDCETSPASTRMKHLYIECEGEPKVSLSGQCKGDVTIDGIEVCNSHWKDSYSHMVCQEYNCSNAVVNTLTNKQPTAGKKYQHVSCEKHHNKLSECKRFMETCSGKLVHIYCVGNIKFNTTEKCGGQIEINYQDRWEKVCSSDKNHEDMLCKEIGCNKTKTPKRKTKIKSTPTNVETALECSKGQTDIRHCVFRRPCSNNNNPAVIYCEGYLAEEPKVTRTNPNLLSIILGVMFSLLLLILIVVFVRIYIARKARNAKNMASRIFSRKDVVEFESGDYADVSSRTNEMDDFSRDRIRSEAGFFTEHEARSTSSFPYDDIDDVEEALPLTSKAYAAGASGGGGIPETASGKFHTHTFLTN
ncbi:hypothetical protein PAMA_020998 [Pampus argenteus]